MNKLTFRPKKSLGQNFLADENIARKIIQSIAPNPNDIYLEIGPGFGALTKYLLPQVQRLIAVEIDRELAAQLRTEFGEHANFELIEADFLKLELTDFFPNKNGFHILGNIPYHITSPVIFKAFEFRKQVADLTLMIQKEVADRIVASPRTKDYGILSVYSQLYSRPQNLFRVSRNVFRPQPDVDSAVVQWNFRDAPDVLVENEDMLDKIIHITFQKRRKMLRRSLQSLPNFRSPMVASDFNLERRPEELTPPEFVELSNLIVEKWKK